MYREDAALAELAEKIIDKFESMEYIKEYVVRYLYSDEKKKVRGKSILGQCYKANGLLEHFSGAEFIIVLYEYNISYMTENQVKILLLHELMHIDSDGKLRDHSISDFRSILKSYGIDWDNGGYDVEDILEGENNE